MRHDDKLRWGVIGVKAGAARAKACIGPHSELVALCDINESVLKQAAEAAGCAVTFTDYEKMLEMEELDAVFIATPDADHCPMTVAALDAGKHVLCEKPMAIAMDEVHQMLAAEERSGKQLGINQVLRTNPRFMQAHRMARSGYLGEIFYAEADYWHNISHLIRGGWRGLKEQGHTPFVGGGCHVIDLLRWCVGEVVEIFAYGSHMALTSEEYPFDDTTVSVLKFENGACGKYGCSYACVRPSLHNFILHGTAASYLHGHEQDTVTVSDRRNEAITLDIPVVGHPYEPVVEGFSQAVLNGERVPICGRDVANTIAVALAADQSLATREPVTPERFEF